MHQPESSLPLTTWTQDRLDWGPLCVHVCDEDFEQFKALRSHDPDSVILDRERGPGVQSSSSSALKLPGGSRKVIGHLWGLRFLICKMEGLDSRMPKVICTQTSIVISLLS